MRFWLQEKAPAGNYVDILGMAKGTTETQAVTALLRWREHFPNRVFRLVTRKDTVIEVK